MRFVRRRKDLSPETLRKRQELLDALERHHLELALIRNALNELGQEHQIEFHTDTLSGGVECVMIALYRIADQASEWQL